MCMCMLRVCACVDHTYWPHLLTTPIDHTYWPHPGASLWRTDTEEDSLASGNLSVLSSFGEPFMDLVAKNACSWHAVARVSLHASYHRCWLIRKSTLIVNKRILPNKCISNKSIFNKRISLIVIQRNVWVGGITLPYSDYFRSVYISQTANAILVCEN